MQDRHPVNDAGQRIYALSAFPSWDGLTMTFGTAFFDMLGKKHGGGYLEVDAETNAISSMLDDDSVHKRTLKFFYNANKMGLLDPDSPTQTYEIYREKGEAGRHIFSYTWWFNDNLANQTELAAQGKGFRLVPFKNAKVNNTGIPNYVGGQMYYLVNAKAPHLDKILQFLDYAYSPDGVMNLFYNRKGIVWDVDENGEPFRTEFGWRYILDRGTEMPGYNNRSSTGNGYAWSTNETSINTLNIHPVWNRRLDGEDWIKKDFAPQDSALIADWKRVMGANSDLEYYVKNNMLITPSFAQLPPAPEDILLLQQRVGAVVAPESWKMVYASSEAEFEAIWKKMVSDAKGIGVDRINAYYAETYKNAVADCAMYVYGPASLFQNPVGFGTSLRCNSGP
jgi:putative aldouronate transport system substrate-binding protein